MNRAASRIDDSAIRGDTLPLPVEQFFTVTETLGSLIERETELLEERRFKEAGALNEEKARLTSEYQSLLATLRSQDEALLGPKTSDLRRQIKARSEDFRNRLARHARLLVRLKSLNEGLIRAISEEVRRQREPVQRYGGTGRVRDGAAQPTSLSLDRNI